MLLASIASISLLVGGIGIMKHHAVSVTNGPVRSVAQGRGAKRRDILSQFLIEAVVIGMLEGLAGILLGWGASALVSKVAGWPRK